MMRPDKTGSQSEPARKHAHERREQPARVAAHVRDQSDFQDSLFDHDGGQTHITPSNLEYSRLDGVTHINIYSKGRTELGRLLSHFTHTPFTHPYYGPFHSMEGFWYYIKAAEQDDTLRTLWGRQAKDYGKRKPSLRRENFKELIIEANFHKIDQTPELKRLMADSALPFDHYYLFGEEPVFVRPPGFGWLVEGFEEIRQHLRRCRFNNTPASWPAQKYFSHAAELARYKAEQAARKAVKPPPAETPPRT